MNIKECAKLDEMRINLSTRAIIEITNHKLPKPIAYYKALHADRCSVHTKCTLWSLRRPNPPKSLIFGLQGRYQNELGWAGCDGGGQKWSPKVVPTFWHFSDARLVRKVTQSVSEVGVSGLANPDTNTVQKEQSEVAQGVTFVTQSDRGSDQKVVKSGTTKSGEAVPYLPNLGKWIKSRLLRVRR